MITLREMLLEKRRLELVVLKAESEVLKQSIRIWKKYRVWMDNLKPLDSKLAERQVDGPTTVTDAVRLVVNGEPVDQSEVFSNITQQFPQLIVTRSNVNTALNRLTLRSKEVIRHSHKGGMFTYTKNCK